MLTIEERQRIIADVATEQAGPSIEGPEAEEYFGLIKAEIARARETRPIIEIAIPPDALDIRVS